MAFNPQSKCPLIDQTQQTNVPLRLLSTEPNAPSGQLSSKTNTPIQRRWDENGGVASVVWWWLRYDCEGGYGGVLRGVLAAGSGSEGDEVIKVAVVI
nr:hypothetical protein [Tanacetum cinerariifolium]